MYYIYALIRNNKIEYGDYEVEEVIYVGQTTNLKQRLYKHKNKEFDSHKILFKCNTLQEAKEAENLYIKHYDPIFNKSLNFHGNYNTIKGHVNYFRENGFRLNENDLLEIMDFAIRKEMKPLFSNKYSYFDFYNVLMSCNNYKQFGGVL